MKVAKLQPVRLKQGSLTHPGLLSAMTDLTVTKDQLSEIEEKNKTDVYLENLRQADTKVEI